MRLVMQYIASGNIGLFERRYSVCGIVISAGAEHESQRIT